MPNPEIRYFDCFAAIGRRGGKDPEAPWTTEQLLAEMERCQVHGALVFSHLAKEVHPAVGNPLVIEACNKNQRLYPCWVGIPHHTGESPHPDLLVKEMATNGVRALKIFPRHYKHVVDDRTLGKLLGALQEAKIVLIVDRGEWETAVQIEWTEVAWICQNFPDLTLLLHSVRWEATRHLVPIADQYPNLHFEFSNYQGNRMLEFWCGRIGHERLLFGTQALEKSIGAARAYVDYSDLSHEQRHAIAGGNLQRLLGLPDAPPPYSGKVAKDQIVRQALSGKPITDMPVIDAHAHIAQKGTRGAVMVAMNEADAKGVVERNRKLGVTKTCVSAWTAIWTDYKLGNQDTILALQEFPGEIVGFAVLDPNYVTDWEAECRYYYEECGFQGMKPYFPRMSLPYNDPRYDPWWEYGNEHHLFALMHPSDNFKEEMLDLAKRFPNINFLLAHSGWTWRHARMHVEIAKKFPNCFLEITFTSVTNGTIEYMVKELGSERVLYGSDAPMRDPFPQFGWVVYADISEEDKRNILGRNMQRILSEVKVTR
ncbi:MAG TPA: amidohydrolase family protein [bacterium]